MVDDIQEIWDLISREMRPLFRGYLFNSNKDTALEIELLNELLGTTKTGINLDDRIGELVYVFLINPAPEFAFIKKVKIKYEAIISDIMDDIEDAIERMKDSAKEDMFDAMEDEGDNEYDEPEDIEEEDMFNYFGKDTIVSWMREEWSHNVDNLSWAEKYGLKTNDLHWEHISDKMRDGSYIDYMIHKYTDEEMQVILDEKIKDLETIYNKMLKEIQKPNNKRNIYDKVFGGREIGFSWETD